MYHQCRSLISYMFLTVMAAGYLAISKCLSKGLKCNCYIIIMIHVFAYLQQVPDLLGNSVDEPCQIGTFIAPGKILSIPTGLWGFTTSGFSTPKPVNKYKISWTRLLWNMIPWAPSGNWYPTLSPLQSTPSQSRLSPSNLDRRLTWQQGQMKEVFMIRHPFYSQLSLQ